MIRTGSPGIMGRETQRMPVTPRNAGMAWNTLRKTYFDTALPLLHRRPGLSQARPLLSLHLFLQPPDFVAHAFPKVDALGGGPMALDVVPPGHRGEATGEHDRRYF